jgi:RsiW-degrading membrane proteinase PrsW (M82 family)
MFVPHRKHTDEPLWPVTGKALLFYMWMMFVPHRKHTDGPLRPVTGMALLFTLLIFLHLYVSAERNHQAVTSSMDHSLLNSFLI